MKILLFCEFHIRRLLWLQPILAAVLLGSVLLAGTGCVLLWIQQAHKASVEQSLHALHMTPPAQRVSATRSSHAIPDLPLFSSPEFTDRFLAVARDAQVPTEEMTYVLETGSAQPYWRYRIAVNVKVGYPELRRFIAMLSSEMPHVTLDNIRCRREDALGAVLTCQLAFSAFFQKMTHG